MVRASSTSWSCWVISVCSREGVKFFEDLDLKDLNPFFKGFKIILQKKDLDLELISILLFLGKILLLLKILQILIV